MGVVLSGRYHGEKHHSSKLTADQVRAIRASPDIARVEAAKYGISLFTVRKIRQRATWMRIS